MTRLERVLWGLTIIGFAVPYSMIIAFVVRHGFDLGDFPDTWASSLAAALPTADLTLAFVAFSIWAAVDNRRSGAGPWWLPIPASLLVGLCFAIPLHFLMRERQRANADRQATRSGARPS